MASNREWMKVEGLKELDEALTELPKATARNVLKRTLMRAGEPIRAAAEMLAPVLKGTLKISIAVGTKLSARQKKLHQKQSDVEVFVGAGPLPQAHLQEFGNANQPPQRFLTPAWEANKMNALEIVKSDLALEIEKARERLARKAARLAAKMK